MIADQTKLRIVENSGMMLIVSFGTAPQDHIVKLDQS